MHGSEGREAKAFLTPIATVSCECHVLLLSYLWCAELRKDAHPPGLLQVWIDVCALVVARLMPEPGVVHHKRARRAKQRDCTQVNARSCRLLGRWVAARQVGARHDHCRAIRIAIVSDHPDRGTSDTWKNPIIVFVFTELGESVGACHTTNPQPRRCRLALRWRHPPRV